MTDDPARTPTPAVVERLSDAMLQDVLAYAKAYHEVMLARTDTFLAVTTGLMELHGRLAQRLAAARREGAEAMREACLSRVEAEKEPNVGGMPPGLILATMNSDTVMVERAIIAGVVATKKGIAAAIRLLPLPETPDDR